MSTRGIIIFKGTGKYNQADTAFRLYQHCDTYPTSMLPLLRDVIRKAAKIAAEADTTFSSSAGEYSVTPEMLAGVMVGESTSVYGMGARIEYSGGTVRPTDDEGGLYGNQGDLEWIYVVDTDAKAVNVYGGGYSGELPSVTTARGTVNPLKYVECLTEEYQEREGKVITAAIRSLKRLGWPVNPGVGNKTGRRAAIEAQKAKDAA